MSKKRTQRNTKAFKTAIRKKKYAKDAGKREAAAAEKKLDEEIEVAYQKYVEDQAETPKEEKDQ